MKLRPTHMSLGKPNTEVMVSVVYMTTPAVIRVNNVRVNQETVFSSYHHVGTLLHKILRQSWTGFRHPAYLEPNALYYLHCSFQREEPEESK